MYYIFVILFSKTEMFHISQLKHNRWETLSSRDQYKLRTPVWSNWNRDIFTRTEPEERGFVELRAKTAVEGW